MVPPDPPPPPEDADGAVPPSVVIKDPASRMRSDAYIQT